VRGRRGVAAVAAAVVVEGHGRGAIEGRMFAIAGCLPLLNLKEPCSPAISARLALSVPSPAGSHGATALCDALGAPLPASAGVKMPRATASSRFLCPGASLLAPFRLPVRCPCPLSLGLEKPWRLRSPSSKFPLPVVSSCPASRFPFPFTAEHEKKRTSSMVCYTTPFQTTDVRRPR
jgi:hypothetical protein